jgi:porin
MRAGRIRAGWAWPGFLLALLLAGPARADTLPPLAVHYLGDLIGDVSGGRDRGASLIHRLDVAIATGDRMFGIDGLHAQADVMLLAGGGFSARRSGDYQMVSNIDAPHAVRPYEAWVEAQIGAQGRAKAGLIDLNGAFDQQAVGGLFLNSSFGIGPDLSQSGPDGPAIFPVTAPGLVLTWQPPGSIARIGLFDARAGDPDHPHRVFPDRFGRAGALLIGEGRTQIGPSIAVQAGLWTYTDRAPRIDGSGRGTSAGAYALIEARLAGGEEGRALRSWLRIGHAADSTNPIETYVGGGVTWGSSGASCGIAVAHAREGDLARRAGAVEGHEADRAETAIEATARWRVAGGLALQPDLQYVIHPGWNPAYRDALVLALRVDWTVLIAR